MYKLAGWELFWREKISPSIFLKLFYNNGLFHKFFRNKTDISVISVQSNQ